MKRFLVAISGVVTLAGCQSTGTSHSVVPSSGVIILQCDGHVETIGDPNGGISQRRTYRLDPQGNGFAEWSLDTREWFIYNGRLRTTSSSFSFEQTDQYSSYISEKSAICDRQAGSLIYRDDMSFRGGDVARVRFVASWSQVDRPNDDTRF